MKNAKSFAKTRLIALFSCLFAILLTGCLEIRGSKNKGSGNEFSLKQDLSIFDAITHFGLEHAKQYRLILKNESAYFSNNEKEIKLKQNSHLPMLKYKGNGFVSGVKILSSGKVVDTFRFRMPKEDTEIELIISDKEPPYYSVLNPGTTFSGGNGIDYSSANPGNKQIKDTIQRSPSLKLSAKFEAKIESTEVDINGNSKEDFLAGNLLSITGEIGNFTRIVTAVGEPNTKEGLKKDEEYTFTYNFENFGEEEISFKAYQTPEPFSFDLSIATSIGKETINLKKGESISYKIPFATNVLEYQNYKKVTKPINDIYSLIELTNPIKNGKLGIAIAKENIPYSAPSSKKVVTINYDETTYELEVHSPLGIERFFLKEGDKLPPRATLLLSEQFYDKKTLKLYSIESFLMPPRPLAISAFDIPNGRPLIPCTGYEKVVDYMENLSLVSHEPSAIRNGNGALLGREIVLKATDSLASGRIKSRLGEGDPIEVNGFIFFINLENRSEQVLNFDIAQVNTGLDKIEGAYQDGVVLKPGERQSFKFVFPSDIGENFNALTLFSFKNVNILLPIVLGLSISVEEKVAVRRYEAKLDDAIENMQLESKNVSNLGGN
mgnify:CR=1 FL=1